MMRFGALIALGVAFFVGAASLTAQQRRALKVYVSADMEGVAGVVTSASASPEQLTREVNAAVEAAVAAGATEVVVSDSHGSGQNIDPELLHPAAKLVRGFPRPLDMMQGLDTTFAAVMFIGYHASEGNVEGTLAHTMSGSTVLSVKLNGREVSEAGFNAAVAGHFRVPVVMISGDDALAAETKALLGDVETAVVKKSLGRHSAVAPHPDSAVALIRTAAATALSRLDDFEPFRLSAPISVDVSFKSASEAEIAAFFPEIERLDAHSVRYVAPDMPRAAAFIIGLMFLRDGS